MLFLKDNTQLRKHYKHHLTCYNLMYILLTHKLRIQLLMDNTQMNMLYISMHLDTLCILPWQLKLKNIFYKQFHRDNIHLYKLYIYHHLLRRQNNTLKHMLRIQNLMDNIQIYMLHMYLLLLNMSHN